jgi:hypothetical protein
VTAVACAALSLAPAALFALLWRRERGRHLAALALCRRMAAHAAGEPGRAAAALGVPAGWRPDPGHRIPGPAAAAPDRRTAGPTGTGRRGGGAAAA